MSIQMVHDEFDELTQAMLMVHGIDDTAQTGPARPVRATLEVGSIRLRAVWLPNEVGPLVTIDEPVRSAPEPELARVIPMADFRSGMPA